jgi:hypothetical protein
MGLARALAPLSINTDSAYRSFVAGVSAIVDADNDGIVANGAWHAAPFWYPFCIQDRLLGSGAPSWMLITDRIRVANGLGVCALARPLISAPTLHTRSFVGVRVPSLDAADNDGIVANGLGACALARLVSAPTLHTRSFVETGCIGILITMGSWRTGLARVRSRVRLWYQRRLCA